MEWNKVKYIDCMDEEYGLPSLPDKSVDLCLTDPPYNINFKGKYGSKRKVELYFDDHHSFDWNLKWFNEIMRICNAVIFTCGHSNLFDWICFKKPTYQCKYHYKSNSVNPFRLIDPILCYGKYKKFTKLRQVINIPVIRYPKLLIHPCPKIYKFWYYLINKQKPTSVIDPFLGSGTTAEVCTKLGIPWLGYEINEVYSQDINKRLKNCKKEPVQKTISL